MNFSTAYLVLLAVFSVSAFAQSPTYELNPATKVEVIDKTYRLSELVDLARANSLALQAAQAQQRAVVAGEITARALPNPELEANYKRIRGPLNNADGNGNFIALLQPLENPALRSARIETAQTRSTWGKQQYRQTELNLLAEVKGLFYEMLRRQEEVRAAREDAQLVAQIRERIRVRTVVGEGARFDLVRADAELAVARNQLTSAELRLQQARSRLLQTIGITSLPRESASTGNFQVSGEWEQALSSTELETWQTQLLAQSPELNVARAANRFAQQRIQVERQSILPKVAVRLAQENEPEIRSNQIGLVLALPIFDRRAGPIAEARAEAERARLYTEQREFELTESFQLARHTYLTTYQQLQALERGVVDNAQRAVEIAEAAYRFGERGILEYLDAQRTYRSVRNELITARYNLQKAKIDLERLIGRE